MHFTTNLNYFLHFKEYKRKIPGKENGRINTQKD